LACSAVYYAMKALIAPDVPPNDGCYRPLHVHVPPGTVLSADPDRPVVGGNHETSQRVVDAIIKALAPVLPDRVIAGGPTTSGVLIFGARQPDGPWAILYQVAGGRDGAPFRITLNPGPRERVIRGKETVQLAANDLVVIETCGGGGYGPPAERPVDLMARDRAEDYRGWRSPTGSPSSPAPPRVWAATSVW